MSELNATIFAFAMLSFIGFICACIFLYWQIQDRKFYQREYERVAKEKHDLFVRLTVAEMQKVSLMRKNSFPSGGVTSPTPEQLINKKEQ